MLNILVIRELSRLTYWLQSEDDSLGIQNVMANTMRICVNASEVMTVVIIGNLVRTV